VHRIAATPGGWQPGTDGVVFVEQTPAALVVLTAADTDVQVLAAARSQLPEGFPAVRVANILQLQQQLSIDDYAETVLSRARAIVVRLLGGRSYWSYGLEVLKETVADTGATAIVIPGEDRPDPELMGHSTVALRDADRVWRYFAEGGSQNCARALQYAADLALGTDFRPPPPESVPRVGRDRLSAGTDGNGERAGAKRRSGARVGIVYYRAHYLAGNTAPIAALSAALVRRGLQPVPVFVSSLGQPDVQEEAIALLAGDARSGEEPIRVLLNATSFSLAKLGAAEPAPLWRRLNVPVLQVILSGGTVEDWQAGWQGLSPRDVAMNVALPEVDGRIGTRAISFKSAQRWNAALETTLVAYEPLADRVEFVADLAAAWATLAQTPVGERRVALVLANYPTRDGRLANGVGLDTPQSCVEILQAMRDAGYAIAAGPVSGDALIARLTAGATNDPEGRSLRPAAQTLPLARYRDFFERLPRTVRDGVRQRWGEPAGDFVIPGLQLGRVFVGVQPARGYDRDPSLNYHAPDLEPTHDYLAFYCWLREEFGAQAVVHVGKHGNLEWLPGKGTALSAACYPEVAFGALPHFYPFIVNDPGEGAQAKRRAQAVIVDHLTPPMTRAELYGPLQQLEALVDEYYEAQSLDPTRLPAIARRILELARAQHLDRDLGVSDGTEIAEFLTRADGYLCELKEAQIRDGLHVFGRCPEGRLLRDLAVAIARLPGPERLGLTRAIARDWGLECDPLTVDLGTPLSASDRAALGGIRPQATNAGDAVEAIELHAASLLADAERAAGPLTARELAWVRDCLLPALQRTDEEIAQLLRGLDGEYVPSGAAGAPTRGRSDVLPTGRNFYSVDIRAIPTETAWDVGRKAAEAVVERYTQEEGEYPRALALSVWGTATMRTGGDDIAQALALMGVRPVWDGAARRVVDFEILPLSVLERPRVDVTLRVSGFFRDGFANLIDLLDRAVVAVAALDEPPEWNPLRDRVRRDTDRWQQQGSDRDRAERRALYRIFGSKPGAYGAGLQGLIDAQNWDDDADLARAYVNWSSYAYSSGDRGRPAPEAFAQRLEQLQIVLHNQDNREHDLLDSDDYYQFQGGLTAAARLAAGRQPQTYFGDNSRPERPRVRHLREEVARVYRSRAVNPKWIAGAMRHGYKGAFELAATVDYLFAYDATTRCVEDHMYAGIAAAYLFDDRVRAFVQQANPWAARDMAERLLEAHQRQLWQTAAPETLDRLRAIANDAEGDIEMRG